jgi:hypothetical protein
MRFVIRARFIARNSQQAVAMDGAGRHPADAVVATLLPPPELAGQGVEVYAFDRYLDRLASPSQGLFEPVKGGGPEHDGGHALTVALSALVAEEPAEGLGAGQRVEQLLALPG